MIAANQGESDMGLVEIVEEIRKQARVTIDSQDLSRLLEASEIIRDNDTCLAGRIRVLALEDLIMVQEKTPDGQLLLWRLGSQAAAERLVNDRLATYERMWDGCGCKVDYSRLPDDIDE